MYILLCSVSAYPADLFSGSSLGLGYQLGAAAAAAAAAAASPWRQLQTAASPAADRRYLSSPMSSMSSISPHHYLHQHHQQPVWSPTSAFTHPAAAAAAGLTEGATLNLPFHGYLKERSQVKIKRAMKHKTSPARLAQLLQPSLAFCFSLQTMTAYRLQYKRTNKPAY